ncbi:MAG: hypothetical protein WBW80_14920 [Acidimicrobiales bacterium]
MNVIPARDFVLERTEADGTKVVPLPAWEVTDNGELLVLPRSFRSEWLVRPQMEGDARCVTTTAARMRQDVGTAPGPFGPVKSPGYVEEA